MIEKLPEVPIAYGARTRPSPYFESTLDHGVSSFSVYNHMLMPDGYAGAEEEYEDLVDGVTVWDVGCERQVEISGPDAAEFTQYLVTRDVSRVEPGRARYTLVCQEDGGILNDPVLLRLASNRFWLSLSDSDILLWAKGLAHGSSYEVDLTEPDVSPLQIQGPQSVQLMRDLFGEAIIDLGFYHFVETSLDGVSMIVARTGWSGEIGFELFLRDGSRGGWLWERVFSAGEPYGVKPGAPNEIRRIEVGLMSYGRDMDSSMNPWEVGLERYVDLDSPSEFVGRAALESVAANGPRRSRIGLVIEGEPIRQGPIRRWQVGADGSQGVVTSATWSPGLQKNIGYALIDSSVVEAESFTVATPMGNRAATRHEIPFVAPRYRN